MVDRRCTRCGAVLSDQTRFCPGCGTPVGTQPPQQSGAVLMRANGYNGQLELLQSAVRIKRAGIKARFGGVKNEKEIQIRDISNFQYKPPTRFVNGYIRFILAGGGRGIRTSVAQDENLVIFTFQQRRAFEAIKQAIEQRIRPGAPDVVLMRADGVGGQLELLQNVVRIKRQGVLAWIDHGFSGDKEIQIRHISSIQFKQAGFVNGYIQFSFLGGQETKRGIKDAASDENTVMFTLKEQGAFLAIKQAIERRMREIHSGAPVIRQPQPRAPVIRQPQQVDIVGQIERLGKLKEQGLLTEQEFQQKKQSLLSRL